MIYLDYYFMMVNVLRTELIIHISKIYVNLISNFHFHVNGEWKILKFGTTKIQLIIFACTFI